MVISFGTAAGFGVAFISDGDANFALWAGLLNVTGVPTIPLTTLDETGSFS